jgi:hypothetical protein
MTDQVPALEPTRRIDVLCRFHFDLTTCIDYCGALLKHVETHGENKLDATYLALAEAAVLSYGRPFTDGEYLSGERHRMKLKQFRFELPEQNEAHGWWLKLRHKASAHSDEFFTQVRAIANAPAGSYHSRRVTITPDMVRLMRSMATELRSKVEDEIAREHESTIGPIPTQGPRWRTNGHGYLEQPEWLVVPSDDIEPKADSTSSVGSIDGR